MTLYESTPEAKKFEIFRPLKKDLIYILNLKGYRFKSGVSTARLVNEFCRIFHLTNYDLDIEVSNEGNTDQVIQAFRNFLSSTLDRDNILLSPVQIVLKNRLEREELDYYDSFEVSDRILNVVSNVILVVLGVTLMSNFLSQE